MVNNRVLITGGAGFIGQRVARCLAGEFSTFLVDNLHPQVHDRPALASAVQGRLLLGDVTNGSHIRQALLHVQPDYIVHLAAETGTGQSLTAPTRHAATNTLGTATLVEELLRAKTPVRHILLASSRAVYGEGRWIGAAGETVSHARRSHEQLAARRFDVMDRSGRPARFEPHDASSTWALPVSVYGATKLSQEHVLSAYSLATGTPLSILRLQNVYGVGQAPNNPYTGIVMLFFKQAMQGGQLRVFEDGKILRDFVHVDDVACVMKNAMKSRHSGTVDIGAGKAITIKELAHLIADMCGAPIPITTGEFRDGDVRAAYADIGRARLELNYDPCVTLGHGLQELHQSLSTSPR